MSSRAVSDADQLAGAVTIGPEAYTSADYARAEQSLLWRKTWLQAGRVEDLPTAGNYITYDIGDDSVIIIRTGTGSDAISAYHNACPHRGRRLIDTPVGARGARGAKTNLICGFHGWTFNLAGKCTYIPHQEDWNGALSEDRTALGKVSVGVWGGWVWINLDPECGPLLDYLGVMAGLLEPFQLEKMRPRWRKWIIFDCNWKVAMEAFSETYHVQTTHPEFNAFGAFRGWSRSHGPHSNIGYEAPKNMDENQAKLRVGTGDARLSTAEMQDFTWENANTNTTMTLVNAARRLKDELPEGTPPADVLQHWLKSARADDAARGVVWPVIDPADIAKSGTAWQVFPNFQIGHAVNNMLCYAARPYGADPGKCIFEAAVYELYPRGEAPETEWTYTKEADWPPVLQQDFVNMAAVQQGMQSAGFRGAQPNPYMERSVANLHFNLSKYMGAGAPRLLD
jgi:phenylpropionate dioxygenase-like ring-hydroxylating dioxygenase large terminal subunit